MMYIHIGSNKNLRHRDILGIFDSDTATVSQATKNYLKKKQKDKMVFSPSGELPKSFVVCRNGEVWLSQLSSASLLGRSKQN